MPALLHIVVIKQFGICEALIRMSNESELGNVEIVELAIGQDAPFDAA